MAYASPKTITDELLVELDALFSTDDEPGEFVLARLRRDANKLMPHSPEEAYTVLSAIEALKWNQDGAARLAAEAVRHDYSVVTLMNVALNMRSVGLLHVACDYMRKALDIAPVDPEIVSRAMDFHCSAGFIHQASAMLAAARKRGVEFKPEDEVDAVDTLAGIIDRLQIPHDRIVFEIAAAHSLLFHHRRRLRGFAATVALDPDGGETFVVAIPVIGSVDDEIHFEEELASLLAEEPGWNPCKLSIEFEMIPEDANQYA